MNGKPHITVYGNLVSEPEARSTKSGATYASFRLAVNPRTYAREHDAWVEGEPSFYQVSVFGAQGINVVNCVRKGDPLLVSASQDVREWTGDDGQVRRDVQLTAEAVGHNLKFGRTEFTKVARPVLDSVRDQEPSPSDAFASEEVDAQATEPALNSA